MSDDDKTQQAAFERLTRNMRDEEAWRAAGCPPGLITGMATPLPPGEMVVHATIDTTVPIAPENIFLPTENPDGTWTTKIPVGHPAAEVVLGQFIDRAITPEEVDERTAQALRDGADGQKATT